MVSDGHIAYCHVEDTIDSESPIKQILHQFVPSTNHSGLGFRVNLVTFLSLQ